MTHQNFCYNSDPNLPRARMIHARTSYDCIFFSIFFCVSNIYQKKGWKIDNRWKSYPYWLCFIYTTYCCCQCPKVPSHECDNLHHQRIWGQVVSSYWFWNEPGVVILALRVHYQPSGSPGNNLWRINTFEVLGFEYYCWMWKTFESFYWVYKYSPASRLLPLWDTLLYI